MKFAEVQVGMQLRSQRYPQLGCVTVSSKGMTGFQFDIDPRAALPPCYARTGHYARAFAGEVEFEPVETIH